MRKNWTREEHILAFNLYCKIPFTKINANYEPVKELAKIIGRTDNSVAMKLANFARLDPALQARNISGLTQGAKGEEYVWNEFHNNWEQLAYESECILAKYKNIPIENEIPDYDFRNVSGDEKEILTKRRINQKFFRDMILASYNNKCTITGCCIPEFLIACHIKPWNIDTSNRINPQNGLCMNTLHHIAFDKGFLTITPDYKILISEELFRKKDSFIESNFLQYHKTSIILPQKFIPGKDFLQYHNDVIFRKNLPST